MSDNDHDRPRRHRLIVGLILAAAAVTTTAVGLAGANDKPKDRVTTEAVPRPRATESTRPTATTLPADPAQRLALLRAFVVGAKSVHAEGTLSWSQPFAALEQPLKFETKVSGEIAFPERTHWIGEGMYWEESIATPEGFYTRRADTKDSLATTSWTIRGSSPVEYRDGLEAAFLSGQTADPSGMGLDLPHLVEIVDGLTTPEVTIDGVKARYRPDQTGDAAVTVELSMGPGNELRGLVWSVAGVAADSNENFDMTADLRLFDWNTSVEIAVPDNAAAPDDTPAIDEPALAAYREVPLFSPAEIPPGFKLVTAEVQDRLEGGGCPEVVLIYADPAAPRDESLPLTLELTIGLPECRTDLGGEEDNQPYAAGKYRGSVERSAVRLPDQSYNHTFVHLTIEGAAVEVSSNLPDAALSAAIASLRPFVLGNEPI